MFIFGQEIKLRDDRGAALLLSITLMVLFSLLTLNMFEMLTTTSQITGNHRHDLRSIYSADAGAEDAVNQLRIDPTLADGGEGHEYSFTGTLTSGGTYNVVIEDVAVSSPVFHREKHVRSVGTFDSVTRVLQTHLGIIRTQDGGSDVYSVVTRSWKLLGI